MTEATKAPKPPDEAVVEAAATSKRRASKTPAAGLAEAAIEAGIAPDPRNGANVGTSFDEEDVLDLTSMVPSRKVIRIPTFGNPKGETYELRLLDDFGIVDQQQLLSWSRRFEALWNKEEGDLTKSEQVQLKFLLDAMFSKVLDAPDEVKADIPDHIRSRVVTSFTLVPLLERQKQEAEERAAQDEANESLSASES